MKMNYFLLDIIDTYTHNESSTHEEFNSGNQSALLFQVNLQRYDFLRGKFALICENYSDAISYFIYAAKKKRIVLDGLIKKRALKHIAKIAEKTKKTIIKKSYQNLNYNEIFLNLNNNINKLSQLDNNNEANTNLNGDDEKNLEKKKDIKLIDKIKGIIENISHDINECNEKQLKDIIILIDSNFSDKLTIDSFVDVTKTILKNYLTNNDRIGIFLLVDEYRIICPMMYKYEIDIFNFSKDLDNYSEKLFRKELDSSLGNEIIQEKLEVEESESNRYSQENSFESDEFGDKKDNINANGMSIESIIKSLNYCINYLKIKEINTNEKFFIYFNSNIKIFMDYLINNDTEVLSSESEGIKRIDLKSDKKINFLLVGKVGKEGDQSEIYKKVLLQYFSSKSELIPFDNMKKIKSILSSNSIIYDNVIYPNEIYK